MSNPFADILADFARAGWGVRLRTVSYPMPDDVSSRYWWLADEIRAFVEDTEEVVSPDKKAWFVTSADMSAKSRSAFAWNQWELDTLAVAGTDERWKRTLREFWDSHFPILLSVKSGYAYFAIHKRDLSVVRGEEPEYDQTVAVSPSFHDFLRELLTNSQRFSRWV